MKISYEISYYENYNKNYFDNYKKLLNQNIGAKRDNFLIYTI